MGCYDELTYSIHADGELAPAESAAVEVHLAGCPGCRSLVAALRSEARVVAAALAAPEAAARPATAPSRAGRRALVAAGLGLAALAALLDRGLPAWPAWPGMGLADAGALLADAGVLVALHASALATVVETLALLTMGGLALLAAGLVRRPGARVAAGLALALVAGGPAAPALALEARAARTVSVGPGERVEGTLAAAGDHVVVEGLVDGDLLVAGRTVDVRGRVTGNVVAAGKRVDVQGSVDGHVYAAAGWLGLAGQVAGSLYGAAREVDLAATARVARDLTLAGQTLRLDGSVGRDLTLAAADARVAGEVGRHLLARGERLLVTAAARIGGDARLMARTPGEPRIADGARLDGARRIETAPARRRLARLPGALFWPAAGFFGALLLGGLVLGLRPGVLQHPAERVRGLGRSLGAGLVVLVATPIVVLVTALTLVGLPVALIVLAAYLVALYTATLVVAAALGRAVLGSGGSGAPGFRPALRALAVGLLLLTVAFHLPGLGGLARVVVACLGVGALALEIRHRLRAAPGA